MTTTNTKTDLREFTKAELVELLTTNIAGWNQLHQEAREASDYLWYADLRYADLRYADLRYANLTYVDLRSADLGSADLRYANLGYANLEWDHPLWSSRADFHSILDAVPSEVANLRDQLVDGKVNGSVYEGECACLCGTIANQLDCSYQEIPGVRPDSGRPAEQWFFPISEGDVPTPELFDAPGPDAPEWSSEGVYRASVALVWLDEWVASRSQIVKALA